jgi:hypothetical protein
MSTRMQEAVTEVVARISAAPKSALFGEGLTVRRFMVSTEPGNATPSATFGVYVKQADRVNPSEDLAIRCGRLRKGDLVLVRGEQRHRMVRRGGRDVLDVSILATDVRLRERAPE